MQLLCAVFVKTTRMMQLNRKDRCDIREGGLHDGKTIMRIVYNGSPKFFG